MSYDMFFFLTASCPTKKAKLLIRFCCQVLYLQLLRVESKVSSFPVFKAISIQCFDTLCCNGLRKFLNLLIRQIFNSNMHKNVFQDFKKSCKRKAFI